MRKAILFVLLTVFVAVGFGTEKQPATVSRVSIEKRLADLKQAHQQAAANLQALGGAIQDCEYWLGELNKAENEVAKPPAKSKPTEATKEKKNGD